MINAVSLQQKTKKKIKMKTNNLSGLIRTHKMGNITNVKIIVMSLALGFAFTACAGNSNKTESKKENKSEINKTKGEKKMNCRFRCAEHSDTAVHPEKRAAQNDAGRTA
jgi:type IV secretory pathway VirB10-like protein